MSSSARALLAAALLASGCAAASNPGREGLRPLASAPEAAPSAGSTRAGSDGAQKPPAGGEPAAAPARERAEELVVARVGGEPIGVGAFLSRLWMRDNRQALETLENLVFARVVMFEADRLGIGLNPQRVDETVERAWERLREMARTASPPITAEELVRRNFSMDPEAYRRQLRIDAIVQLLAERCVRAWVMESPRVVVQAMRLADETALRRAQADLAAGEGFEEVARRHGTGEGGSGGGTRLVLMRDERLELPRLAFATPIGEVGGPLAQDGAFLLLKPEERLEPIQGSWREIGPEVEASLAEDARDDTEYAQWQVSMERRYRIDLQPFLELIGSPSSRGPERP